MPEQNTVCGSHSLFLAVVDASFVEESFHQQLHEPLVCCMFSTPAAVLLLGANVRQQIDYQWKYLTRCGYRLGLA